jgi:SAM-dependent methyltransferase
VGTGRFAASLGVRFGIDPARGMLALARDRGVAVCQALGERSPFRSGQFDFALLVTVDPFVPDLQGLLAEVRRVLRPGGRIIVGMIDRNSALGRMVEASKDSDPFYREAHFHSSEQMIQGLQQAGFNAIQARQTLSGAPQGAFDPAALEIQTGCGEGAFVALCAEKPMTAI